ncbi:MAG: 6,7-dimethyl-8-ribityllumazine synthase [Actinomycetota bacterium]|nr:6,7-dimethyl-8-ribityllumazine synthase [Actinomycetota bacterium]
MTSGDRRAAARDGLDGSELRIGVLSARWNADVVERLHDGARRGLRALSVEDGRIVEDTVPGSFELPMAARILAGSAAVDAIVCLGCVVRGETSHYEIVSEGVAAGLMRVQLDSAIPVAFGVLTVERLEQALDRSQGPGGHNVGEEAATAAVEMACLAARHANG